MKNKVKKLGYPISLLLAVAGICLKILHFQYSEMLVALGILMFAVLRTYMFIVKQDKSLIELTKFLSIIFFILSYLFAVLHWPYGYVFTFIFYISFGAFILLTLYTVIFKLDPNDEHIDTSSKSNPYRGLINSLYIVSALAIIIGALFKIMHWPHGNFILIFGLILIAATYLIDSLKRKNES